MRLTDELRDAAGDQWNRVVHHPFTTELAAGTLDLQVLKSYLIQDHCFLDSFVVLLASTIAKAQCLEDRIPGCQFLAVITGTENTYFERSFKALGVTNEERERTPNAKVTTDFCELMQTVAKNGSLAEMLAVIVVCEWSYRCWGERVMASTVRTDFYLYEWVDLHSGDYFTSVVDYLRRLLDQEGERMDKVDREACESRFLQAVQLEEDFFDHAYITTKADE
jgi:thiaminase/transcriptional activator TenA